LGHCKAQARRRGFVICAALIFLGKPLTLSQAQAEIAAHESYAEATARLERWILSEREAKSLPALSIALIDDQQIVWAKGIGRADTATNVPATADTVCRVGSVSKLFTDLAVMQLVEQGQLDLDAPVSQYLPEFAPQNPFRVAVTLRQLMAHRSGLVREPPVGHYFDPNPPSLLEVVRSLAQTKLVFEPGTRTKYSNADIAVVGAVVERLRRQRFSEAISASLLEPIGMASSSFEPSPDLRQRMASGLMWTYDGQTVATPTFLLGTGPAGNLVSTVSDLGRFVSFLFSGGHGKAGKVLVKAETIRSMMEPQLGKDGQPSSFGLGFAVSKLDGRVCIGHNGAVYGFATDVRALPEEKMGAVVITTVDCANGIARHVADSALRLMLAARKGQPLPDLETTKPVSLERARELAGHYAGGDRTIDLCERSGKLFLAPFAAGLRVEVRARGNTLIIDDRLAFGTELKTKDDQIGLGNHWLLRQSPVNLPLCPKRWEGLIGEYGWDHDVLYILEKHGRLHALIEWFFEYPLVEEAPDRFRFPDHGLYADEPVVFSRDGNGRASQVDAASVLFRRRPLDGENGQTFRIKPAREVESLKTVVKSARPPAELGQFRKSELAELIKMDSTIRLDVRYATSNNFLGTPLYAAGRAFLQQPAAEALVRVHRALGAKGYGLLIHDAYRPWHVTKLFWEATPAASRIFVADPSQGSKHNRGAAVDLTLFDRNTGQAVAMVGGYDEFSPRAYPDYPGGTSRQRWRRGILREAMEKEGFTVNQVEWWHFDYRDWDQYPILNVPFEAVSGE